jgi:pimeloyl-ACP methyl ester carboxylesterase
MSSSPTVTRRRVFYIPGYDPIHPRRYRELYRKESAAQAEISGYEIGLRPKTTKGPYGWHVEAEIEGARCNTDVEVLVWSDIVRDSMSSTIPATYLQLVWTASAYIFSGALFRLMRLRKGPVIAALYPVGMLLLQLALCALVAWGLGFVVFRGVSVVAPFLAPWVAIAAGLALIWVGLRWFRSKDGKLFAYYLMHDYSFSARTLGSNPDALEERMARFADAIAEALQGDSDEVLVVGHSSGAHLAVSILADLIRDNRVPAEGPVLSFLSLGQVVPMVSFLPRAQRLRADLAFLCQREELSWLDVTAPGDGCAFALCDPVSVTGVAPETGKRWPLVISAAFTQTLSPEKWKEMRWRFFRLHFQYLCAFDRPGDYDYFRITAGPKTLGARFDGRVPSKSRIETPVNRYRSVA